MERKQYFELENVVFVPIVSQDKNVNQEVLCYYF